MKALERENENRELRQANKILTRSRHAVGPRQADATLKIEVRRVFDEKFRAYGVTAMLTIRNILAGERVYDAWNVNEDAEYHESGGTDAKEALNSERLVPRKLSVR